MVVYRFTEESRLAIIEKGAEDLQAVKLSPSAAEAKNHPLKVRHAAEAKKSQTLSRQSLSASKTERFVAKMQAQRVKGLEEGY